MIDTANSQRADVQDNDANAGLIARLRAGVELMHPLPGMQVGLPNVVDFEGVALEAADRIEQLEKESATDKQRLDAFIAWFLRDGSKKEIDALGHIRPTGRDDIIAWLDAEISPSDPVVVKQLVKSLQALCDEPRSQKLVGGQVYRTAKELIALYSCSTYSDNPISILVQALKDFVDMAKMYRMDDGDVFRNANALVSKYAFKARTA